MARAVLLDLYETLVTTAWADLHQGLAARLDVPAQEVRSAYVSTRPERGTGRYASSHDEMAAMVSVCGISPTPNLVAELVDLEAQFMASEVLLFGDAVSTLERLRQAGMRLAIVSNCSRPTAPVIERLGLRTLVDAMILSFEVGALKPSPEIFRQALQVVDVPAEEAMFVDDQVGYLDGASRIGISTLQLVHSESRSEPPKTGGHATVTALSQVLERTQTA